MTENVASPRRRFQFRLRTLMIGVTLFCVFGAWFGNEIRIVRERKASIQEIEGLGGYTRARYDDDDPESAFLNFWFHLPQAFRAPIATRVELLPIRRWLGDTSISYVVLPRSTTPEQLRRFQEAFPEAWFGWHEWDEDETTPSTH
jgi:hypothetical protein